MKPKISLKIIQMYFITDGLYDDCNNHYQIISKLDKEVQVLKEESQERKNRKETKVRLQTLQPETSFSGSYIPSAQSFKDTANSLPVQNHVSIKTGSTFTHFKPSSDLQSTQTQSTRLSDVDVGESPVNNFR